MTQDELRARAKIWQERLRLADWDIEVVVSRLHEFDFNGTSGDCETFVAKQFAKIRILDEGDQIPVTLVPYDQELTLVHELLHVLFREAEPKGDDHESPKWRAHERAIHRVSQALVKAYNSTLWGPIKYVEEPTEMLADAIANGAGMIPGPAEAVHAA